MNAAVQPRVDHGRLLADFRTWYRQDVHETSLELLHAKGDSLIARPWKGLITPLLYTLEHRKNLFRTGFSLCMGELVNHPEAGKVAAAAGELAWTCALIIDDLIDRSSEREGHPSAHVIYGKVHTWAAAVTGIGTILISGLTRSSLPFRARLKMTTFGLGLLRACVRTQLPRRAPLQRLQMFRIEARDVNNSTHWALLAPLVAFADSSLIETVRDYADAISVNGKMRNDLLDYCGGSTESSTLYEDFETCRFTFPSIVLWEQELDVTDRIDLERHFVHRKPSADFTIDQLFFLFRKYGTFARCLQLMEQNAAVAMTAIETICARPAVPARVPDVLRSWVYHQLDLAQERVQACENGRP
jgi:geranylgeranyl pyrophosphate synthase